MRHLYRLDNSARIIIILLISVITFPLLGNWVARSGANMRTITIGLLVAVSAGLFLLGERGIYWGYLFWIGLFALGFRTISLAPDLPIHPLVVVIAALIVWVLTWELVIRRRPMPWLMPRASYIVLIFWVWGWLNAARNGLPPVAVLRESLIVLMLIPVFVMTGWVLQNRQRWRTIVLLLIGVSTFVALEGLVEYVLPEIGVSLSAVSSANILVASLSTGSQFTRAAFSIWGSQAATFICALAVPLCWPAWQWAQTPGKRMLVLTVVVIQLAGIYIGGYRSVWLMLVTVFVVLLLVRRGIVGAVLGIAGSNLLYLVMPESGQERFQSLLAALQGNFQDTSTLDRWQRISNALGTAIVHPEGLGWSGAGWVHSDFAQIAANLGIVAGLLAIVWYFSRLWAVFQLHRQKINDPLLTGLLGSFIVVGGMLAVEGVQVLAQVALPVWFIWALVEAKLREPLATSEADV